MRAGGARETEGKRKRGRRGVGGGEERGRGGAREAPSGAVDGCGKKSSLKKS